MDFPRYAGNKVSAVSTLQRFGVVISISSNDAEGISRLKGPNAAYLPATRYLPK
jgi:hypothetical protein